MRSQFYALVLIVATTSIALAETQMWVKVNAVNRRTCPSTDCGVVGKLFHRESAVVYETRNGWGRISKYYDASCSGGRSDYIDSGTAGCIPSNGIEGGKFAEWVSLDFLSLQRPDPGAGATGVAKLVAQSDDFQRFEAQFVKAAEALMSSGQCSANDFTEQGGGVKSTNRGPGVYFTYCDGGSDRIYLDVSTGRTFR